MSGKARPAALITGSSRGIGLAAAVQLAHRGFALALNAPQHDQELQQALDTVSQLNVPVVAVAGDISDLELHQNLLDRAEDALGPLSTLINNAGVSVLSRGDLLDVTPRSYDRCQAVNARAPFFLAQCWARRLLARERDDGRFYSLINVSSANALAVSENRAEYCVSKAAAAMISKAFAVRLGRENIAVYDIQPGVIETEMTRPASTEYRQRAESEGLTLLPRLGQPDEVGRCMATLATGGMPYTTGQSISVDAGMLITRF